MAKLKKLPEQLRADKELAKSQYRFAFSTSFAPALMLLSIMCVLIGRNGGDPVAWFTGQPVIGTLLLACALGLLCFGISEVLKGLRRASKFRPPHYTTRTVDGPRPDGSYTAELSQDGIAYGQVDVGSISALIARSK